MKKTITRRIIVGISILFLMMGSFLIYAVDIISIDPDRFIATLRIQQINLYYRMTSPTRMVGEDYVEKYDIVKVGLKNVGVNSGVLYIRPVDANDEFIDEIHNEIMDRERASIIGGHDNTNNGDETSFILGGSRNTVEGHGTVQIGGEGNVSSVENAVILGSANSSVETPNGVVMASDGGVVKGRDSTKIGGGGTIDESAYNSFAIAGGTDISAPGVFAVGDITAKRPNIVQLNLGQGLIVGGRKFNGSKKIQLSVHGALAVGIGQCTTNMKGAIYYVPAIASNGNPAYCLCACVTDTSEDALVGAVTGQALSNQPYCDPVCWGEGVLGQPQCGTRGFSSGHMVYEYGETEWRRGTNFCKDNYVPHDEYGNEPEFPERGGVTIWTCPGVAEGEEVECKAYRKKDPPQPAVCGRNAARYSYKSERFYGEGASDYCVWNSLNGDNLSENGRPHAYKVLTAQQVKDKEEVEYTTGLLWTEAVRQLNNSFPATGGRTYWICETTNSDNATVQGAETVMQKECFAERMDCNYCAKDGFPYCFDIDFSDECGTGTRGPCREGTDNSCREPLYRGWDQTLHIDSLYSAWETFTKVEIIDRDWITDVVHSGNSFYYYIEKNTTSQIRTGVVHMEATDPSYCNSWDVCIVQCPYEYYWDEGSMSCKKDRPQNAIVNFHCNGGVAHMDNGTAVGELMGSQQFAIGMSKKLKKNNCTKDKGDFLGWSTNSGASVPEWGDEEERTFSEPVTEWLYAVWGQSLILGFDCNGGQPEDPYNQTVLSGVVQTLTGSRCKRDGYIFTGWSLAPDDTTVRYKDEGTGIFTEELDFYAVWKESGCTGAIPYEGSNPVMAKWNEVDGHAQRFLATGDDLNKACAYACVAPYYYMWSGGNPNDPICAKCRPETVVKWQEGWCEFDGQENCPEPYTWFPNKTDSKGRLGLCALAADCNVQYTGRIAQTIEQITPQIDANDINKTYTPRCLNNPSDVQDYQCQFSCKPGYVCNGYGAGYCVRPYCVGFDRDLQGSNMYYPNIGPRNQSIADLSKKYYSGYDNLTGIERLNWIHSFSAYGYIYYRPEVYYALDPLTIGGTAENIKHFAAQSMFTTAYHDMYTDHWTFTWPRFWYETTSGTFEYQQIPTVASEPWFYVHARNKTEFESKVNGLSGCYFWCTGTYYSGMDVSPYSDGETVYQHTCGIYPDAPTLPRDQRPPMGGGGQGDEPIGGGEPIERETSLCPPLDFAAGQYRYSKIIGLKSQYPASYSWVWETSPYYGDEPCHIRCAEGYTRKKNDNNGKYICGKICDSTKQYGRNYECIDCPSRSYPDTGENNLDFFGNAMSCWPDCNIGSGEVAYGDRCYTCNPDQKPDSNHLDSHGNATSCINKCPADLPVYKNTVYYCGAQLSECCLSVELDLSEQNCKAKGDDCYISNRKCICPVDKD